MARAFSARLREGLPRSHSRPSTAYAFLPPSSTTDQLPTTERNFDDSPPTLSLLMSIRMLFGAAAGFFVFCATAGIAKRAEAKPSVITKAKIFFIVHLLRWRAAPQTEITARGQSA